MRQLWIIGYIITVIVRASELEPELIVDLDYETLSAVVN